MYLTMATDMVIFSVDRDFGFRFRMRAEGLADGFGQSFQCAAERVEKFRIVVRSVLGRLRGLQTSKRPQGELHGSATLQFNIPPIPRPQEKKKISDDTTRSYFFRLGELHGIVTCRSHAPAHDTRGLDSP